MHATGQPGSHGYPSHGAFGAQPPQPQPPPETYGNPYGAAAYPPANPQAPAQPAWGAPAAAQPAWGAPAAAQPAWGAPAPQAYGFAPGTQVHVTWSNGQRYPGTVQQTSGTQVLVLFPDGQQHWVEMHYVAAG